VKVATPNELDLTFHVPNYVAKFHQNSLRIAAVREVTDRLTHRLTDTSDFIIGPMLYYSNRTDNYYDPVIKV